MAPLPPTCASGSSFASQVVDIIECLPLGGAAIAAIGSDGVPVSGAVGTSATNGSFEVCLPANTTFSLQMTAPSYPTTYFAEMLNADAGFFTQVGSVSTAELNAVGAFVPGGVIPNRAIVVAQMAGTACIKQRAGWSFQITLPDGGAFPDGGYQLLYLGTNDLPDPMAETTATNGGAVFYNIDPSVSDFVVISAENPDAGACEPINSSIGMTGRVYVTSGSAAIDPFLLP